MMRQRDLLHLLSFLVNNPAYDPYGLAVARAIHSYWDCQAQQHLEPSLEGCLNSMDAHLFEPIMLAASDPSLDVMLGFGFGAMVRGAIVAALTRRGLGSQAKALYDRCCIADDQRPNSRRQRATSDPFQTSLGRAC
ncbi:MAG: hypothetical protein PHT12_05510 [Patescibacteria group bacterium]|nr:hypothetical protein [Patescibacteria group bacterium]